MEARELRAKSNIVFSLAARLVTALCGLVVSKLLIKAYGSEAYGCIASITKMLAYIAILDGGVSGVARAALYGPLAANDTVKISQIVFKIRSFFRKISLIFVVYTLVIACLFKYMTHLESMDFMSTFILTIVISVSTFLEYYMGLTYSILINASQKNYVIQAITIITTLLNVILVIVLVSAGFGLIFVKFISCLVFALRPVLMWLYVRRSYDLSYRADGNSEEGDLLDQKWVGLAQHIAYVLHYNTDIVVLSLFGDLKLVAVYSVYWMVVSGMETLTMSFTSGMEPLFGDMLAKREDKLLDRTFNRYESMISLVSGILFSVTVVMIIPFVRIYTSDVTDVDYIHPLFALLLVLASYLFCIRMPYHAVVTASGSFRQTQAASYGEAAVNVISSVVLVWRWGLTGVAAGTVLAVCFRFVYYAVFLRTNVINRPLRAYVFRIISNGVAFTLTVLAGDRICTLFAPDGYIKWALCATVVTVAAAVIWGVVEKSLYYLYYNKHE